MNRTTTDAAGAPASERLLLGADQLRRRLDPASLPFQTTAEVEPLDITIGQPRALEAIEFGLEAGGAGYNLFVAGAPGSGRLSTVRGFLERFARTRPAPDDCVYVHDFDHADRPRAIRLPAGRGRQLAADMQEFITGARRHISQAFETERYDQRRRESLAELARQREALFEQLQAFARDREFALEATPSGLVAMPVRLGQPLAPEEMQRLPDDQRHELERRGAEVQAEVISGLRRLHQMERDAAEAIRGLDRDIALLAIDPLLRALRERYTDQPDVLAFLDRVGADVPDHLPDFRGEAAESEPASPAGALEAVMALRGQHVDRYRVNVVVANGEHGGAPIVHEQNPTYYNLVGRLEYRASFGTMVTDLHQIRAGALHRANGGFLIVEAIDVLASPFAWEALKRALRSGEVRIENLGEQLTPVPTASLRPQPVALDLKVIALGSTLLYHQLYALDPDFRELFKVKVDFSPDMEWSDEHVRGFAAFIGRCVRGSGLRHFDRGAVARVVEQAARLREHQGKLSARLLDVADLVSEASFWAGKAGHETVLAGDVERAVSEKERRSNLLEERLRQVIGEGTVTIDTDGARPAQVNGLSIIELGDHRFGIPSRVTARVAPGRGAVESIEREIELSGPIHSKGFLTLSGYLSGQYGQRWPLPLRATLTFEQSYEGVEGDSAASTELYALLSALSGLPISQGIAVTGSVDQHGEVQAVGGVTQKVEGFFAVCREKGLNGEQGVIIPAANVRHLMLTDEVVEAVREGRFHVWAVRTIDEGIEILCGRPAGERLPDGSYPEGSVHRLVEDRLGEYAERLRSFAAPRDGAP